MLRAYTYGVLQTSHSYNHTISNHDMYQHGAWWNLHSFEYGPCLTEFAARHALIALKFFQQSWGVAEPSATFVAAGRGCPYRYRQHARWQQCAPAAMRAAGGGCGACWARWRPPAFLGQLSFWVLWDSPAGLGLIGCDGKHTGQHATRHTGQHATRHTAEHTAQHAAGHASWHRPYCAQPNPRCDST